MNSLTTPDTLMSSLGSFWNMYFRDRDFIATYEGAQQNEGVQRYREFLERVARLSRFNIPLYRADNWYFLTLKQSDENTGNSNVIKYGDSGIAYGDGSLYGGFGLPKEYIFDLPTDLVSCTAIMNRLTSPSVMLVNGTDFTISDRAISFSSSPFQNTLIPQRIVIDEDGNETDKEVGLWVYLGEWDYNDLWNNFGFAVSLWLETSQNYKDLINSIWDMMMFGGAEAWFRLGLSAITGSPCVIETTETVESITTFSSPNAKKVVVTDQHVYEGNVNASTVVAIGDILNAGDPIFDTWEVYILNQYAPDIDGIKALALNSKFLSGGYHGELVFNNKKVTLDYQGIDGDGKAFVTFEVGGYSEDVTRFWESVQAAGKQPGKKTLAELLDTRTDPSTQPTPGFLPSTINPLEFVVENLFKNNLFLVKLLPQHFSGDPEAIKAMEHLRNCIPSHTSFVLLLDMTVDDDEVTLDRETPDGSEFMEEDTSCWTGTETEDTIEEAGTAVEASYEDGVVLVVNGNPCS